MLKWINIPKDKEGYTLSFTTTQLLNDRKEPKKRGPLAFFEIFGFIVVREVISKIEVEETKDEFFSHMEKESNGKFDREDVNTFDKWKSKSFGMAGTQACFGTKALKNRQNPNVYKAFACILNEKNLLVNHDRWAMYRPTKLFPKLKTRDNIHLDFNPRLYLNDEKDVVRSRLRKLSYSDTRDLGPGENNNITRKFGLTVQAVLNFCDNREKDGGLQVVPGSHEISYFEEWVRDLDDVIPDKSASFAIQPHNKLNQLAQRITMRAGSIAIWNQRLVHGSKHNQSDKYRLVQFIRMFPRRSIQCKKRAAKRACSVFRNLPKSFLENGELTSIGKTLFGFADLDKVMKKKILSSIPPPPPPSRRKAARLVTGDLLKSKEEYIVHQTNCRYKPPGVGLAKHIFKKYPHSDVYTCRHPWKPNTEYDTPGSITIRGGGGTGLRGVVNLFGQNFQSKKEKNVKTFEESRALRLKWFKMGLDEIRKQLPDLKSIAFPFQIGCGLAGGDWNVYLNEIERFANSFDDRDVDVVVYKLSNVDEKEFKKDVANDKKKSRTRRYNGGRVQGAWKKSL